MGRIDPKTDVRKNQSIPVVRGASARVTTKTDSNPKQENETMATPTKPTTAPTKPTAPNGGAKPPTPPTGAAPTAGADAPKGEEKAKKEKRAKARYQSTGIPGYTVRVYKDLVEKYGVPCDPKGAAMVLATGPAASADPSARAQRKAAKEAEKEKMAKMTDDEKMAYARQKREAKAAEKAAKAKADYDKLVAQVKADVAAGRV